MVYNRWGQLMFRTTNIGKAGMAAMEEKNRLPDPMYGMQKEPII